MNANPIGLYRYLSRFVGNLVSAITYPFTYALAKSFGSRKIQTHKPTAPVIQQPQPIAIEHRTLDQRTTSAPCEQVKQPVVTFHENTGDQERINATGQRAQLETATPKTDELAVPKSESKIEPQEQICTASYDSAEEKGFKKTSPREKFDSIFAEISSIYPEIESESKTKQTANPQTELNSKTKASRKNNTRSSPRLSKRAKKTNKKSGTSSHRPAGELRLKQLNRNIGFAQAQPEKTSKFPVPSHEIALDTKNKSDVLPHCPAEAKRQNTLNMDSELKEKETSITEEEASRFGESSAAGRENAILFKKWQRSQNPASPEEKLEELEEQKAFKDAAQKRIAQHEKKAFKRAVLEEQRIYDLKRFVIQEQTAESLYQVLLSKQSARKKEELPRRENEQETQTSPNSLLSSGRFSTPETEAHEESQTFSVELTQEQRENNDALSAETRDSIAKKVNGFLTQEKKIDQEREFQRAVFQEQIAYESKQPAVKEQVAREFKQTAVQKQIAQDVAEQLPKENEQKEQKQTQPVQHFEMPTQEQTPSIRHFKSEAERTLQRFEEIQQRSRKLQAARQQNVLTLKMTHQDYFVANRRLKKQNDESSTTPQARTTERLTNSPFHNLAPAQASLPIIEQPASNSGYQSPEERTDFDVAANSETAQHSLNQIIHSVNSELESLRGSMADQYISTLKLSLLPAPEASLCLPSKAKPEDEDLATAMQRLSLKPKPSLTLDDFSMDEISTVSKSEEELQRQLEVINRNPDVIKHILSLIPDDEQSEDQDTIQATVNSLPADVLMSIQQLLPQEQPVDAANSSLGYLTESIQNSPTARHIQTIDTDIEDEPEFEDDFRSLVLKSMNAHAPIMTEPADSESPDLNTQPELSVCNNHILQTALANAARIDAYNHSNDMEKKLAVQNSNGKLYKILKQYKSIDKDEYPEIARAVAVRLNGTKCDEAQLKEHVKNALVDYKTRRQRLAPSLFELIKVLPKVDWHQPFQKQDLLQLTYPGVLPLDRERAAANCFNAVIDIAETVIYKPVYDTKTERYYQQQSQVEETITLLKQNLQELEDTTDATYHAQPGDTDYQLDSSDKSVRTAVVSDLKVILKQLQDKQQYLQILRKNDPRKISNLFSQAETWENAANRAIDTAEQDYQAGIQKARQGHGRFKAGLMKLTVKALEKFSPDFEKARSRVTHQAAELRDLTNKWAKDFEGELGNSHDLSEVELPTMIQNIDSHVKALEKITAEIDAKKYLEAEMIKSMESLCPPETTTHELPIYVDGQLFKYTVKYTPAKDMSLHAEGSESQGKHNPFGLDNTFTPSQNRDSTRAQNLMGVEVKDENGQVIRRELRVGSMAPIPKRIKDKNDRIKITESRVRDTLTGIITHNQAQIEGLGKAMRNQSGGPIELPFTYQCFLSPDKLRKNLGIHENEYQMALEASEALEKLEKGPQELEVIDSRGKPHKIKVQFKPRMYIFPVNQLAFSKISAFVRPFELADDLNDKAMAGLIGAEEDANGMPEGDAGSFIKSEAWTQLNPLEQENFKTLCKEHRRSIAERNYHYGGQRAFYDIWLVDQITQIMHQPLLGGCKSAKDRTNNVYKSNTVNCCEADARMKLAKAKEDSGLSGKKTATPMDVLSLMPHMTTQERIQNQTAAHVVYGGLQQQGYNCGKFGYKVEGTTMAEVVPSVYQITMVS